MTVLVKMDFRELQQVDPRLLNHMRLLHSMVGEGRESRGPPCWGRGGGSGGRNTAGTPLALECLTLK